MMTKHEAIKTIKKLLDGLHKLKGIKAEEYQVRMSADYVDALIETLRWVMELITEGMEE